MKDLKSKSDDVNHVVCSLRVMTIMDIIQSIFEKILAPLTDFFVCTYLYIMGYETCIRDLQDEMGRLNTRKDDVKDLVDAEERRRMERTNEVRLWLENVAKLEREATMIQQEYEELLAATESLFRRVIPTYNLSKKADEARKEASKLREEGSFEKVAVELVQVRFQAMPSTPVVGMASMLDQLRGFLSNDKVGRVGIYGLGGVGKTALLKKFNNEILAKAEDIDFVIYIEVSNDLNMDEIQRVIEDRLGLLRDKKTPKERALEIYKVLSEMNFVLILDDLWERLNLLNIGVPIPEQPSKSKIILATRIEDVCNQMDVDERIKVECLQQREAWELFKKRTGEALVHSNSEIEAHAKELVDKCGGLPLALITVGRAMASKRYANEWKHGITVLKVAPWQLLGMEIDVLGRLKCSFDNLPTDKFRTCLLFCALYPENFSIHKDCITEYCIGEGLIDDLYARLDEMYNMGHHLLGVLKTASLLERGNDEDEIKMHPMVRAMALWIAKECGAKKNKWIVNAGVGLKEAPRAEKWSEAEIISLVNNDIHELHEEPNSPHLRTLMLHRNLTLERICHRFFHSMSSLSILNISYSSISTLPPEIGSLACLQYLNFCYTQIKVLPEELGSLVNLKFLLLSHTPLETIPNGVISRLLALEVLYMDKSYGDWKVESTSTGLEFQEIEGLRRLEALDITIKTVTVLNRFSILHGLVGSTRRLHLNGCPGLKTIQLPSSDLWKNMTELRRMSIADCGDLENVIIDGSSADGLPSLQGVILEGLTKARIVWKGGCLQQLTYLYIENCSGIEKLIEVYSLPNSRSLSSGRTLSAFPSLEILKVVKCPNLKHLNLECITPFPKLRILHIDSLPNFRNLSSGRTLSAFPSLEILKVVKCPNLKHLNLECITPFPKLRILHIDSLPNFRSLSSGRTLSVFPSLEILKVVNCPNLKHPNLECISPFPKLRILYIGGLPNIRSLSSGRTLSAFPSLEILKVVDCPNLKHLNLARQKLKEIKGINKWWNGLEWEDNLASVQTFVINDDSVHP